MPHHPTAEKIRRLMHYGQILQSHARTSTSARPTCCSASIAGSSATSSASRAYPDIARRGVLLRKFGQEVIRITAGKRCHGTGDSGGSTVPDRRRARRALQDADQMVLWSRDAVRPRPPAPRDQRSLYDEVGLFRSHLFSIVRADGALDLYDGGLRLRDARGGIVLDHVLRDYDTHITEEVKPGPELHEVPPSSPSSAPPGLVPVGPLARVQNCDSSPARSPRPRTPAFVAHGERGHPRSAGLPLGAHDRDAPRRRGDPAACSTTPTCSTTASPKVRAGAKASASSKPARHLIHHYRGRATTTLSYCNPHRLPTTTTTRP